MLLELTFTEGLYSLEATKQFQVCIQMRKWHVPFLSVVTVDGVQLKMQTERHPPRMKASSPCSMQKNVLGPRIAVYQNGNSC